jgi:hypothetical protein
MKRTPFIDQHEDQTKTPGTQGPTEHRAGPLTFRDDLMTLQHTIGNRAVRRLLQTKGLMGPSADPYEKEAESMAEQALRTPPAGPPLSRTPEKRSSLRPARQIDSENKPAELAPSDMESPNEPDRQAAEPILAAPPAEPPSDPRNSLSDLTSKGQALSPQTRQFFEPRLGHDFRRVRVVTDRRAQQLAADLNAQAFTFGSKIFFNKGRYRPQALAGKRLLAHELSHVVQQTRRGATRQPAIQRQPLDAASSATTAQTLPAPQPEPMTGIAPQQMLIVEDTVATPAAGQMYKSEFLTRLRAAVCHTAGEILARVGRSVDDCPYLKFYLNYYSRQNSRHIESALHKYLPNASQASVARDYIPMIEARVRRAVQHWVHTGKVTGVPPDAPRFEPPVAAAGTAQPPVTPARVDFFARSDGPRRSDAPGTVQGRLGRGQPLDSSVKGRMESAFGSSFSTVRVHTDANAAQLADRHRAHAFTVGPNIAFGSSQYRPGTLIGDALLAHELAHVMQQGRTSSPAVDAPPAQVSDRMLETDADRTTVGALSGLWRHASGRFSHLARQAKPRLRSGLRLQRCGFMVPFMPDMLFEDTIEFNGDPFLIEAYMRDPRAYKVGTARPVLIDIYYLGDEDALSTVTGFVLDAPDKVPNPTVTQKTKQIKADGETRQVDQIFIDVFGDRSYMLELTHELFLLKHIRPPMRHHRFCTQVTGKTSKKMACRIIDVKPWLAEKVPKGKADEPAEPVEAPVPVKGQRPAAKLTTTTQMQLILRRLAEVKPHAPAIVSLEKAIGKDLAQPAGAAEASLKANVARLNDTLVAIQPVFSALSELAKKENYLPGIADEVAAETDAIKALYLQALQGAYEGTDLKGEKLIKAEKRMLRLPDIIVKLYLSAEGIEKIFNQIWSLRNDIRSLRKATGRMDPVTRTADKMAGLDRSDQSPIENQFKQILGYARKARFYEDKDVLQQVRKLTLVSQSVAAVMTALALYEQFIYWEQELDDSIINGIIEVAFTSRLDEARAYKKKLDAILKTLEKYRTAKTREKGYAYVNQGVKELSDLVTSAEFKDTVEAIQDRLKTIATIDILGKTAVILALSALTSGAAAAAVGGTLRGLAMTGMVARTGTFVAEVLAFTVTSRIGQQIAFGKLDTSLAEDLVWNAAMFGVLKVATKQFTNIFMRFRDPNIHKLAFALGKAGTAVVALHVFAEAQHLLSTGKLMSGEERKMAALQNVIMVAALEMGRFITKPLEKRIEVSINNKLKNLFKTQYESLHKDRLALVETVKKLERGQATKAEVETLLKQIEGIWARELRLLSDGAKRKAFSEAELQKAVEPYKNQIAQLELRLSQLGFEAMLGTGAGSFRPMARGVVAYTPEGREVLESFYKSRKGKLRKSSVADVLEGRLPTGELTFYVLEGTTPKKLPTLERMTVARDLARMEAKGDELAAEGLKRLESMGLGERRIDEILASAKEKDLNVLLRALADPAYKMQIGSAFYTGLAQRPAAMVFARTYGGEVLMRLYRTYGKRWSFELTNIIGRAQAKLEAAKTAKARSELLQKLSTETSAGKVEVLLGKAPLPKPPKPIRATKKTMGVNRAHPSWKAFRVEAEQFAKKHGETLTEEQIDLRADLEQVLQAAKGSRLRKLSHASKVSILDRFDNIATKSRLRTSWANNKRGILSEWLFLPKPAKAKVAFLKGKKVRIGIKDQTIPDYPIEQAGYTEWVNLKSDLIDTGKAVKGVFSSGKAAAKTYRAKAVKEAANLPAGDKYSLDFIRDPGPLTRKAMLDILLATGSSVHRVKFGEGNWISRSDI